MVIAYHLLFSANFFFGFLVFKMRHVEDDSTIMWAIEPDSSAIAKHAKFCGDEVEMVVPFERTNLVEVQYLPVE